MRNLLKAVVAISVIIIVSLIIILLLLIHYKISLDPIYNYISTIASLIVILLMLITIISTENSSKEHIKSVEEGTTKHIKSVEDATKKQIASWERWDSIRKKQFINALISELNKNIEILEEIPKEEARVGYVNLILTNIERSLYNPPTDDEKINYYLFDLYYLFKLLDQKIILTRISPKNLPGITLQMLIWTINEDYKNHKEDIVKLIKDLEEYEHTIRIKPIE